jgi:hypothetical protein
MDDGAALLIPSRGFNAGRNALVVEVITPRLFTISPK